MNKTQNPIKPVTTPSNWMDLEAKGKKMLTILNELQCSDMFFEEGVRSGLKGNIQQIESDLRAIEFAKVVDRQTGLKAVERSKQKLKYRVQGQEVSLDMVWEVKLPAPQRKACVEVSGQYGGTIKAESSIPLPPIEAINLMKHYRKTFNFFALWWVPKDIKITVTVPPDPILLGVVLGGRTRIYFELHRWIDETVEDPYYNAVAY